LPSEADEANFIFPENKGKGQEGTARNQPFTFSEKERICKRFALQKAKARVKMKGKVRTKGGKAREEKIKDLQDPTIHLSLQRGYDPCVCCSLLYKGEGNLKMNRKARENEPIHP
jgi:hypothetical protein